MPMAVPNDEGTCSSRLIETIIQCASELFGEHPHMRFLHHPHMVDVGRDDRPECDPSQGESIPGCGCQGARPLGMEVLDPDVEGRGLVAMSGEVTRHKHEIPWTAWNAVMQFAGREQLIHAKTGRLVGGVAELVVRGRCASADP